MIYTVKSFNEEIQMKFGFKICGRLHRERKNEIHRGEATGHEGKSTMFQRRTDIIM